MSAAKTAAQETAAATKALSDLTQVAQGADETVPEYAVIRREGKDCCLCALIKVPGTTSEWAYVGGPLPSAHPQDIKEIRKKLDAWGVQIVAIPLKRLPDIQFRPIPKGHQPTATRVEAVSAQGFFAEKNKGPWDDLAEDDDTETGPW